MSWSARVTKSDGTVPDGAYNACGKFIHGAIGNEGRGIHPNCYIPNAVNAIAGILTAIDFGADNHMATGSADLKCNGFEPFPEEPKEAA